MAFTQDADVRSVLNTNRITEAGDDDAGGTIDSGVMDNAIDYSDSRLRGILLRRYDFDPAVLTPTTAPSELRWMSAQLAAYWILRRNGRGIGPYLELRDEALQWAQQVRDGLAEIGGESALDLADGTHLDRLRLHREKGAGRYDGEPAPGDVGDLDDNEFFVSSETN